MWDLIVSVPDHCLSFYFFNNFLLQDTLDTRSIKINILPLQQRVSHTQLTVSKGSCIL